MGGGHAGPERFEVLSEHARREGGFCRVHDAVNGERCGPDDLSLEGDVELTDFGVTGDGRVCSTFKRLHGVVGEFSSRGVVIVNGSSGGNVVGDRTNFFVGRCCSVGHHIDHVGDGVAEEITLGGGTCPIGLGRGAVVVRTDRLLGKEFKIFFNCIRDSSRRHRAKSRKVQQHHNDTSNQHVSWGCSSHHSP